MAEKMKRYIIILAFASVTAGCSPPAPPMALRPWFASDATVSNRTIAVNASFPAGTPVADMQTVLGANGAWHRFHGPSGIMHSDGSYTDLGYTQSCSVVYAFEDGLVHINIQDPEIRCWATFDKATCGPLPTQIPMLPHTNTAQETSNKSVDRYIPIQSAPLRVPDWNEGHPGRWVEIR